MPSISEFFGLGKQQAELDFVNVDPNEDRSLFIDPYVFASSSGAWAVECHEAILSFFETALQAVRAGEDQVGQALLDQLSEPNETCLGLSSGVPSGRGVSGKQAYDLYRSLRNSRAAQTGLLSELSECELFVEGIGPDKISDITTNIIRHKLIQYTNEQCKLHGIRQQQVASGRLWIQNERRWGQEYVQLPVVNGKKIIFVPKSTVRWT